MRGSYVLSVLLASLAGCGLSTSGLDNPAASDAATHPSPNDEASPPEEAAVQDTSAADALGQPATDASFTHDATSPSDATSAEDSTAPPDATSGRDGSPIVDAGPPDAHCSSNEDAGVITGIPPWSTATPPTIDGDLSEWTCFEWHPLTLSNAGYANNASGLSADIAVAWDAQNVFIAATIVDPSLGAGTYNSSDPVDNSSFEVYASGDTTPTGNYDSQSHHYITDYRGLCIDYGPAQGGGSADTTHSHFAAATKYVSSTSWTFEAAVGWQALLGGSSFGAGGQLWFDFGVNSGNGSSQTASLILSANPAAGTDCSQCGDGCCCGAVSDYPYCDTTLFLPVTLQ